ncbi:MAG TPA: alpha-D-ribose 1-methylphosphonate 5-triphosphate diphosphatase, partial [Xanthobacteraceae bacterium]|nr:alpha-D-ribose 1-methylphosphonate 5-triphosphate diphosphatase [Xanthobacteraceae bacterium]
VMPRPGVHFAMDIALFDTDRQVLANGITTVFHGVTWSWEPGLRGADNARAILAAMEELQPRLGADTKFHLRHETFNLEAEPEIIDWIDRRRIGVLGFNNHLPAIKNDAPVRPAKIAEMAQRSGISHDAFQNLVSRIAKCADEVPGSIERLSAAARANGIALLSHDDISPEQRRWYRSMGCRLAEFPTTIETAQEAASAGDHVVLGAPNVVRGGSHIGWIDAKDMIARGMCSILASDYYYPAPLLAAFRLAADGVTTFETAWTLVSEIPAAAVGLPDRGIIAVGRRADLILVDVTGGRPRVVATIVAGRVVYLAEAARIHGGQ